MSKHFLNEELQRYLKRDLSPNELLEVDEHLAFCEDCHARLIQLSPLDFAQSSAALDFSFNLNEANEHLDYETELQPFVDQLLNAEQTNEVQAHLRNCEMCCAEVDDLIKFRKALAAEQAKPVAVEKAGGILIWRWSWLNAGVAASLFVALILVAILFGQFGRNLPRPEVAKNAQQNSALPSSGLAPQKDSTIESTAPSTISETESGANSIAAKAFERDANKKALPQTKPFESDKNFARLAAKSKTLIGSRKQSELKFLPTDVHHKIELALATGRIEKPTSLARVAGNKIQFLSAESEPTAFKLLAPIATRIRSLRPTFRWQTVTGASGYRVSIYDSNLKKVLQSDFLSELNWRLGQNLKRGEVYSWQVTAFKDGEEITAPLAPAPEAKFQIISQAEEAKLLNTLVRIQKSPLQTAVVLAQTGLLDDAENKLRQHLQGEPSSRIARQLLQNVQSWR